MSEDSFSLDPKETAFIFIEFQNEFTTKGGKLHDAVKDCMDKKSTLENGKKLLDKARETGCTVMHSGIQFDKDHKEISSEAYGILASVKDGETFLAGEWNSAFCETMTPIDSDIIIKGKTGLCGFATTNMDFVLRQNGIKNVVICGFLTNCCVESTMRTAYEKGYKVYTVQDACAATSVEGHDATFKHNFVMFSIPTNSDDIVSALSSKK